MSAYQQLKKIFNKIADLRHVEAIADWDEQTMMPQGGGEARAKALAALQNHIHEILIDRRNGELIEQAKAEQLADSWDQANLRWMEKIYQEAACLPADLVQKRAEASLRCVQAWRVMRSENNWKDFQPLLAELFNYIKEAADIQAETFQLSPYDTLIDSYSPGFNQSTITPILKELKTTLPSLIQKIIEKQKNEKIISFQGSFPASQQRNLGLSLMRVLGFDFNHGRLDISHHPFCGGVPTDVRITTRYNEKEFITSAMAICHETGHARYEQGLPKDWLTQPVGRALGMAVHESQSLLVEMQACRSQEFMDVLAKAVIREFGEQPGFTAKNLHIHYTQVKPSYIRVDADEVTYPLHIILRYELEQKLFNNELTIADLPDAWNESMIKYFNLSTKDNFKDGVMQDVHWPSGIFGYFPAYTLGALIAAQLFAAAIKADKTILPQIGKGDFSPLFAWLGKHIHAQGSSVGYQQLLLDATGEELRSSYFLDHIQQRYL